MVGWTTTTQLPRSNATAKLPRVRKGERKIKIKEKEKTGQERWRNGGNGADFLTYLPSPFVDWGVVAAHPTIVWVTVGEEKSNVQKVKRLVILQIQHAAFHVLQGLCHT